MEDFNDDRIRRKIGDFIISVRKLLFKARDEERITVSEEEILNNRMGFRSVNGEWRYFINEDFLAKIPEDVCQEIEQLWSEDQ